ncbi:MAG: class I SAM-dependent methyltransferase [Rhodothermales bacterium]
MNRTLKNALKSGLRRLFESGQRLGFDVLPRHFYSEIPDVRLLRQSDHWKSPFSMIGVEGADAEGQLAFVREVCTPELVERVRAGELRRRASEENGETGYGPIEADFLYAFVRSKRPRQIFQIGCGVSTALCLMAAEDAGYTPEIICVDPYPTGYLKRLTREGKVTLIEQKVELVDLDRISALGNDLLFFVDSTHTLGPAGEVSRIILEMLPRLKEGAWAHFHDITFPYDYDRNTLDSALVFPHESVLLHAFLAYNSRFALRASLAMLHYAAPAELATLLPNYRPAGNDEGLETTPGHFPSAAYLQVTS